MLASEKSEIKTNYPIETGTKIAIIGMSCRFPGAKNITEFWQNLQDGIESIKSFNDNEILDSGIDLNLLERPDYVKAGAPLGEIDLFDAGFFGFTPKEAKILDPQQRIFLECAWEALESSGYVPDDYNGLIGVYAGSGFNTYLLNNIGSNQDLSGRALLNTINGFQVMLANDKDFLSTRVSYKLNLKGPSVNVQTACSTSLVAVHLACQNLIDGESDMALAGGASILVPEKSGYHYQKDMILSPDAHCRAFDANAKGTIFGNGVGIVVLKRLENALADGDCIHAVIKGSAINNDGHLKVGFTAPSVDGQADVISEAMAIAEIHPETVTYIEAHGTGTPLGDPIEIAALTQAFRKGTQKKGYCAIGSVKTNFGHLIAASGVAGLIKTVLALKNKKLLPSLNFKNPNPRIDFTNSPFYVNTTLAPWTTDEVPRRAGISSFGIGGTNAHLILEEAPVLVPNSSYSEHPLHLFTLSAKTDKALSELSSRYLNYLQACPEMSLADVCFTTNVGRQHFDRRLFITASSTAQVCNQLKNFANTKHNLKQSSINDKSLIAFLYTGQGAQYIGMGRQLYQTQPVFRQTVDQCDEILQSYLEKPLLSILYSPQEDNSLINQTEYTQPALFALEYALTQLWKSWGIEPTAVMGHSVGEYVAACVAEVFSLKDGLRLISERARLMQSLPQDGNMVAVFASESQVREVIDTNTRELVIAAVNSPNNTIISGSCQKVQAAVADLQAKGFETKELRVSHAFHSPLMDAIVSDFEKVASKINYSIPKIDLISNINGNIVNNEVVDYQYWVNHLRQPVQFLASIETLYQLNYNTFIEIGPKPTLSAIGSECLHKTANSENKSLHWLPSLRYGQSDWQTLLDSLGKLYLSGVKINWLGFNQDCSCRRTMLPTYPFQRQSYWIDTVKSERSISFEQGDRQQSSIDVIDDWFYRVQWQPKAHSNTEPTDKKIGTWIVFADNDGLGERLAKLLEQWGHNYILIYARQTYVRQNHQTWSIDPTNPEDYLRLFNDIQVAQDLPLVGVLHLWSLDILSTSLLEADSLEENQAFGCRSVLCLIQALPKDEKLKLWLVTRNAISTQGKTTETLEVAQAPLWGLGKVIALEHPDFWGGMIDLDSNLSPDEPEKLLDEIFNSQDEDYLAFRNSQRFVARLTKSRFEKETKEVEFFPENSYLITGGTGALGLKVAKWIAKLGARNIVLLSRKGTSSQVKESLKELEQMQVQVTILKADVSSPENMHTVFEKINDSGSSLRGIIHTAGIIEDRVLINSSWECFNKVMAPKVKGTWILHKLSCDLTLDFFVCFSSMSSLLGVGGQGNYAAANAFMDAIAGYRQSIGLSGLSINWGPWEDIGMAANISSHHQTRLIAQGINSIKPKKGLKALSKLLGQTYSQVAVLPIKWSLYLQSFAQNQLPPLLKSFNKNEVLDEQPKLSDLGILHKLRISKEEEHQLLLTKYIQQETAKVLGLDDFQIDLEHPLNQMGLDSLMMIELRNTLNTLDINISLEKFMMGININQLTAAVLMQLKEQNIVSSDKAESLGNKHQINQTKRCYFEQEIQQKAVKNDSCLVFFQPNPKAQIRLIGFPYAGGNASVFQSWSKELPETIEITAVQLPGRVNRLKENFFTSMEELVEVLTSELIPYLDKPFAFFGHCVGGVQAFEVAHKLYEAYNLCPIHLFIAGSRSPQFYNQRQLEIDIQQFNHDSSTANHKLSEEKFVEMLREFNFANDATLLEDEEMRNLILPIIKADYQINNNYIYKPKHPLNIPITAFGGRVDPYVTGEQILGWSEHTTSSFETQFYPGDHYFMELQRSCMIGAAVKKLNT